MAKILVVADHQDGDIKKPTLTTLTLARQLAERTGGSIDFLVIGSDVGAAAANLTGFGAGAVHTVEGPGFTNYLAQPWATVIAEVAKSIGATYVLTSSSSSGKDFLPRVAAKLGAGMIGDCSALTGEGSDILFKRPMYAGNILATVRSNTDITVATVRSSEFDAAAATGGSSPVQAASVDAGESKARFVKFEGVVSNRPDLGDASTVVSGGRGLKDAENFAAIMNPLADALGAAIGASRAAVDSGFCANDLQIGQTGKVVAPNLYIAVALSGAIQHLAGMKGSKTIVAINKDEEAPIFQISDYGLVADAFKAVPELVEKLNAR